MLPQLQTPRSSENFWLPLGHRKRLKTKTEKYLCNWNCIIPGGSNMYHTSHASLYAV